LAQVILKVYQQGEGKLLRLLFYPTFYLKPGFTALTGCTFHASIDPDLQESGGAGQIAMAYDPNGQRVLKVDPNGSKTYYVQDAVGKAFAVYGGDGNVDQYFIYGNDCLGEFNLAGVGYKYYIKDHLGSTRATVNASGTVQDYYDYYPFGMIQRSGQLSFGARFTFTAKELDSGTNWYYFGKRYYDPAIGRFLSPDRFADMYPSLSPYQYAANNPLRFIDVNGDSLILTGSQEDINKFTEISNNALGGFYNVTTDENGLVVVNATDKVGPMTQQQQAFHEALMGAASFDEYAVNIGLVSGTDILVGSYHFEQIDMADIAQFGNGPFASSAGALGHEIVEQTWKQIKGYSAKYAHEEAIGFENRINASIRGADNFAWPNIKMMRPGIFSGNFSVRYSKGNINGVVKFWLRNNNITRVIQ